MLLGRKESESRQFEEITPTFTHAPRSITSWQSVHQKNVSVLCYLLFPQESLARRLGLLVQEFSVGIQARSLPDRWAGRKRPTAPWWLHLGLAPEARPSVSPRLWRPASHGCSPSSQPARVRLARWGGL